MVSLENLTGLTGILLDTAVQAAETAERGPGTSLMPVAAGLIAALALMAFFIRFSAKKGELDRKYDKHTFDKRK